LTLWVRGASKYQEFPFIISAMAEASDFKSQLGFEKTHHKQPKEKECVVMG